MSGIMDALGYASDALDKPGRAVRGLLAGKGREGLAAIPFSDSLGITDAKQRTSGRDLTDALGVTDKGDQSFGSHALGFGAEMLTDPLNLIAGAGAYKAAPTIARGLKGAAGAISGLDAIPAIGRGVKGLWRGGKAAAQSGDTLADALRAGVPSEIAAKSNPFAGLPEPSDLAKQKAAGNPAPGEAIKADAQAAASAAPRIEFPSVIKGAGGIVKPQGSGQPKIRFDSSDRAVADELMQHRQYQSMPWYRQAQIAGKENIPVRPLFANGWASVNGSNKGLQDGETLAHYLPRLREIEMNMGFKNKFGDPIWTNNGAMGEHMADMQMQNWLSNDAIDHIAHHEVGHALHHDSVGNQFEWMFDPFDPGMTKLVDHNIGEYASSKPGEAIAEIYAALKGGRNFGASAAPVARGILKDYAGNPLMEKLGKDGLLKGVGLSALLAAYGLNSGGEEPPGA